MEQKTHPEIRLMMVIDSLTQETLEIPIEALKKEAKKSGIEQIEQPLEQLKLAGLVTEENGVVTKIAKRLFW